MEQRTAEVTMLDTIIQVEFDDGPTGLSIALTRYTRIIHTNVRIYVSQDGRQSRRDEDAPKKS
jgi:hypothetical protein